MADQAVELITAKGAVDELRARKRKEKWRNTISFQKSKKNWGSWCNRILGLAILFAVVIGPLVGAIRHQVIATDELVIAGFAALYIFVLIFYMPLALVSWTLAVRRHGSAEDGIELGMSYAHYIQLRLRGRGIGACASRCGQRGTARRREQRLHGKLHRRA